MSQQSLQEDPNVLIVISSLATFFLARNFQRPCICQINSSTSMCSSTTAHAIILIGSEWAFKGPHSRKQLHTKSFICFSGIKI